jgi:glycosyltransferase involved in cell wall biosynthesis
LYPPVRDPLRFHPGPYGDYVFYPSRIAYHKRQWLAIRAMHHVKSSVRLVIAGAPDHPSELARVRALAARAPADRVTLIPRWISEEEKVELLAGARAILYIPHDEDSYGYVSLEAFHAHKPVITCTDSGGTLELIKDEEHGFVVAPTPGAVAAAMDRMFDEDGLATRLGDAAARRVDELGISWGRVISALTS